MLAFQPGRFGLKSPFCGLCSLLAGEQCVPGLGTAVGSSAQGLCSLGCPAQGSLFPLAFPGSVHGGAASPVPRGSPCGKVRARLFLPEQILQLPRVAGISRFPVSSFPCRAHRMPAGSALVNCQGVKAMITVPVSRPCRGCSVLLWGMNES